MKAVEVDHGAVGTPARIAEGEIHDDVSRGKREIGILERRVVYLGVQLERRECAVTVLALDHPQYADVARCLHPAEVVRIDRWDEREDAPEVLVRCSEAEVQALELAGRLGGTAHAEIEIVKAHLGGLEGVGLLSQISRDV